MLSYRVSDRVSYRVSDTPHDTHCDTHCDILLYSFTALQFNGYIVDKGKVVIYTSNVCVRYMMRAYVTCILLC